MKLWVWQNFGLELPDDWEMLQFGKDSARGRCAFADRYEFRLEFNWRRADGAPDLERMMSDYRSRLEATDGVADVRAVRSAGWRGVESRVRNRIDSRYGRYFEAEGCLVELVFLWPGGKDRPLLRSVLSSFREVPPGEDGCRRWKAFGMDLQAGAGLALKACTVQPAHAEMLFADAGTGAEERYSRRGLLSEWFTGSVSEWLARKMSAGMRPEQGRRRSANDHHLASVTGGKRAPGVRGAVGRRLEYRASAWICPTDGRLYAVSRLGTAAAGAGRQEEPPVSERLRCCGRMGAAG